MRILILNFRIYSRIIISCVPHSVLIFLEACLSFVYVFINNSCCFYLYSDFYVMSLVSDSDSNNQNKPSSSLEKIGKILCPTKKQTSKCAVLKFFIFKYQWKCVTAYSYFYVCLFLPRTENFNSEVKVLTATQFQSFM